MRSTGTLASLASVVFLSVGCGSSHASSAETGEDAGTMPGPRPDSGPRIRSGLPGRDGGGADGHTAKDGAQSSSSGSLPEGGSTTDGGNASSSGGSTGQATSDGGNSDASSSGSSARASSGSSAASSSSGSGGLHVVMGSNGSAGHIVDGSGETVELHGVDRSGTEYACIQGWGIFDGPSDQTSITAIASWNANAVRVPLNEDCWLGINGVSTTYGGAAYVSAIKAYVELLTSNNMVTILDLHWAAPGSEPATGQLGMADADHAPAFWSSVASTFADNGRVVFDLFNEPFITDWSCWLSGGMCAVDANNVAYEAAGMASLLQAVRRAGANNVVILGGLGYASEFSSWVSSVNSIPTLPAPLDGVSIANVAASWHIYDFNDTGCPSQYNGYGSSQMCDTAQATAAATSIPSVLAAGFPFIAGESGISAYQTTTPFSAAQVQELEIWYEGLLTWIAAQGQSYLAWDWNTSGAPYLLLDYTGTPTPDFGVTYKAHLAGL
jgi:hypothetical protein